MVDICGMVPEKAGRNRQHECQIHTLKQIYSQISDQPVPDYRSWHVIKSSGQNSAKLQKSVPDCPEHQKHTQLRCQICKAKVPDCENIGARLSRANVFPNKGSTSAYCWHIVGILQNLVAEIVPKCQCRITKVGARLSRASKIQTAQVPDMQREGAKL